jgi:hypothetical protein
MFTQCSGGKERSRAEFEALAAASGFTHCKFVCQTTKLSFLFLTILFIIPTKCHV